jgi:hypothetical protein
MELLYWITRFDALRMVFDTILISSGILGGILIIALIIGNTEIEEYHLKSILKYLKILAVTFIITLTVKAFVPSTKEALMIYGVGSTVEYLKSNEKAMKLPDKCIDALDAWIEELNKKEKADE